MIYSGIIDTCVQEDVILDTMTVREALTFAAQMKLPGSMSVEAKVDTLSLL